MRKDFVKRRPVLPQEWFHILIKTVSIWLPEVSRSSLKDCSGPEISLTELLRSLPEGDPWNDAELYSVFAYARGSKLLSMPREIKDALSVPE